MNSINSKLLSELQRHITNDLPAWLEDALYKREHQHLVLNQHAIVSIADQSGNITYVNDKFCHISGYSREELTGQSHRLLKSGEHTAEFYQNMWHTIADGKVWQGEVCNRRKDGSLYWVASTISPFLDDEGKPYQFVSIRTDISHVKAVEAALRESEERHHLTLACAKLGTGDWNVANGHVEFNERWAEMRGYRLDEVEPHIDFWKNCIHPNDMPAVEALLKEHFAGRTPFFQAEYRALTKSGDWVWILNSSAVTARNNSGAPLQMAGTEMDITDRKQAEHAAETYKERLRRGQLYANIGTWDWNIQTGELFWTERIAPLFGYPAGDLKISYDNFLAAIHPDDRKSVIDAINASIDHDVPYEIEHRVVWHDGTVRWLLERGGVNRDANGKPLKMLGVVQDITARVEAELAMDAARNEANRANTAKSQFLSSMSHELRTPMNSILGFAQLLQYTGTLSDEHKDFVGEIIKAGDHLLELINGVLDLAKVESGHIEISLEPVEISTVVDECMSLVSTLADKRNIQLSHGGLQGVMVRADRTRFRQVLLNLLSNAIKYNREGGSVKLKVQPTEEGERLRILITDTGQGIPAGQLQELFQPFHRLNAENSGIEGTGIGLTITRRIIEMMGGTVDVQSEIGVGSTFWIELPRESREEASHKQDDSADTSSMLLAPIQDAAQRTVLYIEDNPSNIKLMAHFFGRYKHIKLLTACTPELGIELALTRHPDLIFLDINMPGMDGYQVFAVLKADTGLKSIPVIAVTANAMSRDIERGLAAGFADYLTKPLNMVQFHAVLDKLLESNTIDT